MKKTSVKLLLLLTTLLCVLLLSTGCTVLSGLQLFKNGGNTDEDPTNTQEPSTIENNLSTGQADDDNTTDPNESRVEDVYTGETVDVVLYFVSADGSSLEAEVRSIAKAEGLARATVNELLEGPTLDNLSSCLPATAELKDINIRDGVCIVDFSSSLLSDMSKDSNQQLMALYSIVNTLTQFDSVDYVQILVDGKTVNSGIGGVDISSAIAPVSSF